jgi:trk system potassium uptake protein
MKIIIAGCGKVGRTIVEQLSMEGHEIAIIDRDAGTLQATTSAYDVIGVAGNAASYSTLKEAGIEDADLMIAATNSDEINMLSCLIANKAGRCHTIARVRSPEYTREVHLIKDELGLTMTINPEQNAAIEMARILRTPTAIKIDSFAAGRLELMSFEIPGDNILDGLSVIEVRRQIQSELLICAVERGDDVAIPAGGFTLHSGDIVHFVAEAHEAEKFFKAVGVGGKKIDSVMIVGGGKIAIYLAKILTGLGMKVKVIERERSICEDLARELPKATIICGDASDQDVLLEEGVSVTPAFVSLTGIDESNVFFSLFARESNPKCKIITKINRISYDSIIDKFGLGSIVSPRTMTAENIVSFVRAMQGGIGSNVETVYKLVKGKVEALEFIVKEDSAVRDIQLKDLNTKPNILIAGITRGRSVIYPNGLTSMQTGDRVVVVTTETGIKDLDDIVM